MATARTFNNNMSPESIAILRKIREIFASPEFFIGGGTTTLAAAYFIYNHETEQKQALFSAAIGIFLIVSGLALTQMRTYHLPPRNPLPTSRDTPPTEPFSVPYQRNTSPTKSSAVS